MLLFLCTTHYAGKVDLLDFLRLESTVRYLSEPHGATCTPDANLFDRV